MSYSNIIDPLTGTISREYLPPTHQSGITQIITNTPDDLIIVQVGNVASINLNQDLSLLRANISERFRFGDQAEQINDEVIIDQGGIDVKNGDITIENGADSAILQAGDGDRLIVNAATVAYTSELPTVALTGGSNITITNNSSGSNYSFQVAATGDLGVASVVSTDPNILVSGTENVSLALAPTLELMNVIIDNALTVEGSASIQAGIDLSANGSDCVLFTFNNALTVNEEQVALLSDIPAVPPITTINAGTNISVSNPSTNTFTINNTLPATSITAGTGVSVSNPSTNTFTISNTGVSQLTAGAGVSVSAGTGNITVANTGVLAVNAGTGIQVSGLQSSRQVAIANIGTPGTYSYPTSITTNAQGQVSAVSAGSAPVVSVSGGTGITVGGTATSPSVALANIGSAGMFIYPELVQTNAQGQIINIVGGNIPVQSVSGSGNITISGVPANPIVNLANAVNITSGNSVNFNSGSSLSINSPITTNTPPNNAGSSITMAIPLVSDGTAGPSAGLTIQTAPGSATNGNVSLSLNAPDNVFATTLFAPATTGSTGGTTAGQLNLWGYPSSTSPFYHSFNTNQAYCNLQIAPDGSEMIVGNVIGGNAFTQTANTGCQLKVAGTNSSGNGVVYGRVYDDTFYTPPGATPPTINSGTGISVANPSANTYTITNTAPYVAPTATVQNGGNYTIQLSDLGDTILFDAPAGNQSYTITLPTTLAGATAGQTVFLGRSPLDTTLGSTYTIQTGIITLGTLGTSTPTSSILQFIISSASGGSIVWELVGQRLSAGANISITGTTDNTIISAVGIPPTTAITAGNNTTVSNPSAGSFTIGSSVPYWGAGTSSSSTYLYQSTAFGTQNITISLAPLLDKTGLYMFNVNCQSTFGGTVPAVGGGAINVYLTGTPVATQGGAGTFISSYDMNAVSGYGNSTKQFFAVLPAGGVATFNARPYDGNYNSNFSIWLVALSVQCIYLGAFSN